MQSPGGKAILPSSWGEEPAGRERLHQCHPLTRSPRSPRSSLGSPGMQGHPEEEEGEKALGEGHGTRACTTLLSLPLRPLLLSLPLLPLLLLQ